MFAWIKSTAGRVTMAHLLIVVAVVMAHYIRGCRAEAPAQALPVSIVVASAAPPPPPAFEELVRPREEARPPALPQPERTPIEVSRDLITRATTAAEPLPRVPSSREVRRALAEGVEPREPAPREQEDDDRYYQIVRETLYSRWQMAAGTAPPGTKAHVRIRLGSGGRITLFQLTRASGYDAMDRSVQDAVASVDRIAGLSEDFISRNAGIVVVFEPRM